jgi:CRP-like cAMP-binding protein
MTIQKFIFGYLADEEVYKDTEYIIKEGSSGEWVYVVLEGQVTVKKMTPKGLVTLDNLKEGDIFGEMILWQTGKGVRTASVIADGRVKVGILNIDQLRQDYESISPRLKSVMNSLMKRLEATTQKAVTKAVEIA